MRVVRAIIGALSGYLIFALTGVALGMVSGRNLHAAQPVWFVALTAAYGVLFAGIGGLVASRIAPHRGWAVTGMACLLALGAAVSLVTSPAADAQWSQWVAILLAAPLPGAALHRPRDLNDGPAGRIESPIALNGASPQSCAASLRTVVRSRCWRHLLRRPKLPDSDFSG